MQRGERRRNLSRRGENLVPAKVASSASRAIDFPPRRVPIVRRLQGTRPNDVEPNSQGVAKLGILEAIDVVKSAKGDGSGPLARRRPVGVRRQDTRLQPVGR